jgi:peptide/nickel transport system substrate-binding protein
MSIRLTFKSFLRTIGVFALLVMASASFAQEEYDLLRVVLNNAGTGNLDVVTARHTKATLYARMFGDFLVNIDPNDLSVHPGLATDWTVNDDATVYTFTLRNDVTFHDGTPFNAEAVKFNFDSISEAKAGAGYAALGAARYADTTVLDEFTVQVTFNETYVQFLAQLGLRLWFDSPTAVEANGDDYGTIVVVSTGPYKVVEWIANDHILLERNDAYTWGPGIYNIQGLPYARQIEIRGIPEIATRRATLESGQADIVMIGESDVAGLDADSRYRVELEPKAGTVRQLQFNLARAPMDDVNVRLAIAHAIDREGLVAAPRYSGAANVAIGILGRKNMGGEFPQAVHDVQLNYDLERAGELLDASGWVMGPNGIREKGAETLTIEMIFASNALSEVQPIQAMLADVGIDLKLVELQTQAWFDAEEAGNFDMTIGSNSGTGLNLMNRIYQTGGTNNWWGLSDATLDGYFDTIESALTADARYEAAVNAQVHMLTNAYAVPLIDVFYPFAMRNEVNDVFYPAFSWPSFYQVWITN